MRSKEFPLATGDQAHVYSNDAELVLQLRRSVPTRADVLAPSFKVAVQLTPSEALALASELLAVAAKQVHQY